jgi:predicted dienelactone hydrolase
MQDPRLKAIVLMDPLAVLFDRDGLAPVRLPALLLRPQSDEYLGGAGNALALAAGLPQAPEQGVVPGSHFVFIDPCPPEVAEAAATQCRDAPGIDRAAVHRQIETVIADFLRKAL